MVLEKIIKIQNVGRFVSLHSKGNSQFRKLTLLFGANGHGKTTLAGVLRSLKTGKPEYVTERATLGQSGDSVVDIRLSSGNATFKNGNWDKTVPELEIFDSTFISDNVYTGEHVDSEHRKNLYEVIVGAKAVALAKQIDASDAAGRAAATEIRASEEKLRGVIQAPFSIDAFLALEPEEGLDDRIKDATTKLSAVRKAKEILARRELEPISVPDVPQRALDALRASSEAIAADAELRVRQHVQSHLDRRGEQWLAQGVEYLRADEKCPFCARNVAGVELVKLLRTYFSAAYREHGVAVQRAVNDLEAALGEGSFARFQKQLLENDARIQGWADLSDLSYAHASAETIEARWRKLYDLLRSALAARLANPAEQVTSDQGLEAALRDYRESVASLRSMNAEIERANTAIGQLKHQSASIKEESLEAELRRLRNTQLRQAPEVQALCSSLQTARSAKKTLEEDKKKKRTDLENLAEGVLTAYETAINALLKKFGANFTITGTKPSFQGGKASSTYQISINSIPLDLGDSDTPRGKPCFRTALSSGDKSTLALAFFLASLQRDPDVSKKVVVLDDPLSSLDVFRTACTQHEVEALAARAAQVIVLSHDPFFLKKIFDGQKAGTTAALHITRAGQQHAVEEWDVGKYCSASSHQDYFVLRSFLDQGAHDLRAVARAIRPYLEGDLRNAFPAEFPAGEWLGDFTRKLSEATSGPLMTMKPKLQELSDLKDYSSPFHHTDDSQPAPMPNEDELRAFVTRAIAFVQS